MKIAILGVYALYLCAAAFAKEQPVMKAAKVISQDIHTNNGGTAAVPIGGALVAVPINRRADTLVVETSKYRLTLSEVGKNMIVLPVGGTIQYFQDGNWFVVLDSKKKKHKFSVEHMETLASSLQK